MAENIEHVTNQPFLLFIGKERNNSLEKSETAWMCLETLVKFEAEKYFIFGLNIDRTSE